MRPDDKVVNKFQLLKICVLYTNFLFARLLGLIFAYMYHDWLSVVIILWVAHSCMVIKNRTFSLITYYFYLPLMIIICMFYYITNIDKVVPESVYEIDRVWAKYAIFQFEHPLFEVLLMQALILSIFFWIKMSENMPDVDDNLEKYGVQIGLYMTTKNAYTAQYLFFLFMPVTEAILLLMLVLVGLQTIDVYHIVLLFNFNIFIVFPKKKEFVIQL